MVSLNEFKNEERNLGMKKSQWFITAEGKTNQKLAEFAT